MNISVILPSLDPDEKLMFVIKGLIKEGFEDIIIVNDGSHPDFVEPFKEANQYSQVTILPHEINKGKGSALKTAFKYCLENRPQITGVVTVDGDNQHLPKDIKACCESLSEFPNHVILGCRDFSEPEVPFKSRYGNNITKKVFQFACGIRISDTQTGLRVIPRKYLEMLLEIPGNRFEYETQMLLELHKKNILFKEVKIETVYIEENATTHFRPFKDSIKIYSVILKFALGSGLSFIIDILLFTLLMYLFHNLENKEVQIFIATVGARIISSIFNYIYNRKAVFEHKESVKKSVVRYYSLAICQMAVSYGLVYGFTLLFQAEDIISSIIKIVVDISLFFISFQIQRKWVFFVSHKGA